MYIRKASRTYNGKTYFNYLLVESVLTRQIYSLLDVGAEVIPTRKTWS